MDCMRRAAMFFRSPTSSVQNVDQSMQNVPEDPGLLPKGHRFAALRDTWVDCSFENILTPYCSARVASIIPFLLY